MKKPVTYADWSELFERFGNDDDNVFDEMESGSFDLDAGTAERFYVQAEKAYKNRKELWLEKFQRSFQTQTIKSIDDFGVILLTGKKNLIPLLKFSTSKGLPEDLKNVLKKDLEELITEIKKSLKNSLPKEDQEKEKMILIINTFKLPEPIEDHTVQNKKSNQNNNAFRKIIF